MAYKGGILKCEKTKNKQFIDMTGQKHGRLTVLEFAGLSDDKSLNGIWKCQCDCGVIDVFIGTLLRSGVTKSCGCYRKEQAPRQKPKGHAAITAKMRGYIQSSKKRGLNFDMSREYFEEIVTKDCHYCGSDPKLLQRTGRPRFIANSIEMNGIDRVDNSRGYDLDNCVPCCETCNRAKLEMTRDDFLEWARKLVAHQDSLAVDVEGLGSTNDGDLQ